MAIEGRKTLIWSKMKISKPQVVTLALLKKITGKTQALSLKKTPRRASLHVKTLSYTSVRGRL